MVQFENQEPRSCGRLLVVLLAFLLDLGLFSESECFSLRPPFALATRTFTVITRGFYITTNVEYSAGLPLIELCSTWSLKAGN